MTVAYMLARVSLACLILASNKQYYCKDGDNEVIENLMLSEIHDTAV